MNVFNNPNKRTVCECHNSPHCRHVTPRCIGCVHNEKELDGDSVIDFDIFCYNCNQGAKMKNYIHK